MIEEKNSQVSFIILLKANVQLMLNYRFSVIRQDRKILTDVSSESLIVEMN